MFRNLVLFALCGGAYVGVSQAETAFPGATWAIRAPAEAGMESSRLDAIAAQLGGRGCVIKDGYVVKQWGDQAESKDWLSSVKPVISTLLFFAIEEGKVKGVDQPIAKFGWPLQPRHQGITFRHLGAMNSGYARPEGAGEAWAYNDFAIQLYQKTLFDKVFQAHGNDVASTPERLGPLGFEDGLRFSEKHRMKSSVRDFARIVWFWCQKGNISTNT
jgi:CubicO group peptidase (beta-lactamase class C family)